MKIDEIRASFTVYGIASKAERLESIVESLGSVGYLVAAFSELTAAFSEIYSNPPHFVLFDFNENKFDLRKAIQQVVEQLPESHVFLVAPLKERENATSFFELGIYDLILTPLTSPNELVRAIDRATERDYFMYLNEQLMRQKEAPIATEPETEVSFSEDIHLEFVRRLFAQDSHDNCLKVFLKLVSQAMGGVPGIYFRYVGNRRVLVHAISEQVEGVELQGLGLNLNDVPGFRTVHLREPTTIEPLKDMIDEVFHLTNFLAWPVDALGEIQGVVCFLTAPQSPFMNQILKDWLFLLGKALNFIESEKRLHVATTKDYHTGLLNRQAFVAKVSEEISRSRRTHLPVAIVSIAVDQYGQLSANFGLDETQVVMRTMARILEKHSRVNDILGRTGVDEFGLLLPHTDKRGALIKAERLRLIVSSADFSRMLSQTAHLTISLGVSEYPSLVRDAEELKQSADEALFQVRKTGDKTCTASVPAGFEPDFEIDVKGH